jgi:peptide/nickel transport system substrate-binding protein
MKKIITEVIVPIYTSVKHITETFTRIQWFVFYTGVVLILGGLLGGLIVFNESLKVSIPRRGGTFSEGIVGTPRFINPVLAISDADKDLTQVLYNGLMKRDKDGALVPDLAESYTVSEDGKVYTFKLKDNIYFHDDSKVTVDDVTYTVEMVQNQLIKSPIKTNWEGITVKKESENVVSFTLKQRYVSFLENTTLGILPKRLWVSLTPEQFPLSDLNTKPVGSGPYKMDSVTKNSSGIPTSYTLTSFNRFIGSEAYIKKVHFVFFGNERELVQGFRDGDVDSISQISPVLVKELEKEKGYTVSQTPLPRVFGIFLNQNKNQLFTDARIREAINLAINRQELINSVLSGYGTPMTSPIPSWLMDAEETVSQPIDVQKITTLIEQSGYEKDENGMYVKQDKKGVVIERLAFTLTTADAPELKAAGEMIKNQLLNYGIDVTLTIFDSGTLAQTVIRERSYEALLFGQNVEQEAELFAFWHSSQRNDPGLNIALYANARVDELLERIHKTDDKNDRQDIYEKIGTLIQDDTPAIFLYSPSFIYVLGKGSPTGVSLAHLITPKDRLQNINTWFINTERVWKWFAHQ